MAKERTQRFQDRAGGAIVDRQSGKTILHVNVNHMTPRDAAEITSVLLAALNREYPHDRGTPPKPRD